MVAKSWKSSYSKDVTFVGGIPVNTAVIDGEESEDDEEPQNQARDSQLGPLEMFEKYDVDMSGSIDFQEFKALLSDLSFDLSDAKAKYYFKKCDKKRRGAISFEEFRVALFTCDPSNPSRTIGFSPSKSLCPKDIFSMFDEDESGCICRAEFADILAFMKIDMSVLKQEEIFSKYGNPDDETISYASFQKIWLTLVDVKVELQNRGVKIKKYTNLRTLVKKLEALIVKEERAETKTLTEAEYWVKWSQICEERMKISLEAMNYANSLLSEAIDEGGQVYLFGLGAFNRFDGMPAVRDSSEFLNFEHVIQLWRSRVNENVNKVTKELKDKPKVERKQLNYDVSLKTDAIADKQSIFSDIQVSMNTVWLWGRQVKQVTIGASVAYALTENGEVFCWGGSKRSWKYVYNANEVKHESAISNQDSNNNQIFTSRTQLLKKSNPAQLLEVKKTRNNDSFRKKYSNLRKPEIQESTFEENCLRLTKIAEYFNIFDSKNHKRQLNVEELEKSVDAILIEHIKIGIEIRGQSSRKKKRPQLLLELGNCILLEIECLGIQFHMEMKEYTMKAIAYQEMKDFKQLSKIIRVGAKHWVGLDALQKKVNDFTCDQDQQEMKDWENAREERYRKKLKKNRRALESVSKNKRIHLDMNGITSRGPALQDYEGKNAFQDIAVGSRHAVAVHQSGWGVGTYGRLGQSNSPTLGGQDVMEPQLIKSVESKRFRNVSCGFSHSIALTNNGEVFVWGSAATGKLGLKKGLESNVFCLVPIQVRIADGRRVRKISCGPGHTAVVTRNGELFVWGCGDGGRLGLGDGRYIGLDNELAGGNLGIISIPTQVESLENEYIVDVSCGVSHTAVLTSIKVQQDSTNNSWKQNTVVEGGKLFVCGSAHALGRFMPSFTQIQIEKEDGVNTTTSSKPINTKNVKKKSVVVKQVSCGSGHTGFVTIDGEVYAWGDNTTGCTGHPKHCRRIPKPLRLKCFYQTPVNVSIGKNAVQSSVYKDQKADIAVNGIRDGSADHLCCQTLRESCPFWEVDLGNIYQIDSIKVWNRVDTAEKSAALFPFYIFISETEFENRETGKHSLNLSKCKFDFVKFSENQNPTCWSPPSVTTARYVRLQLHEANVLHFAEIEVFGFLPTGQKKPKIQYICCGDSISVALTRPTRNQQEIEEKYIRAVCADPSSRFILRQYEVFYECFYKHGNCESFRKSKKCYLCTKKIRCPICRVFEILPSNATGSVRAGIYCLKDICDEILKIEPNYEDIGIEIESDYGDFDEFEDEVTTSKKSSIKSDLIKPFLSTAKKFRTLFIRPKKPA